MCVRQIRTWKGSGDQVKIRVIWFQLHLLILCHCHVFRSGASCDRLALVWYLLKQTWYLDILITYCLKKTIPKTQDHTTSNTFVANWCSWNFHMFPYGSQVFPCFSTSFETSSSADIRNYAHVHHKSFSKGNAFDKQTSTFTPARCLSLHSSTSHHVGIERSRFAGVPQANGMVGADKLDLSVMMNSQVKLIWGPSLSPIRDHTDHSVQECLGMLKIPV